MIDIKRKARINLLSLGIENGVIHNGNGKEYNLTDIMTAFAENYHQSKVKENELLHSVSVCSCCGKNLSEVCGSCVSDIAQSMGEQARNSR